MNWHSPDNLWVQQYLEGHLSLPDRRRFEQHLEQCPDCRCEVTAAQQLDKLIQSWKPELEVPSAILESRIRQSLQTRSPAYRLWGLAAAAVLLIVAGAHQIRSASSPTPPTVAPPSAGLARSEPRPLETAAPARPLATQQRVWTTGSSSSVVAFAGQVLTLSPQTRIHVESQSGQSYLLRLTSGSVRVQEHGEHIAVVTPHLRVDPLGTDYQVTLSPGRSRVDLYTGKVRVTRLSDHRQQILLPGGLTEVPPRPTVAKPNPSATPQVIALPHLPSSGYPVRPPTSRPDPAPSKPPSEGPEPQPQWFPVEPQSPRPWSPPWTEARGDMGPKRPESGVPNWQQRRRLENWKRRQNLPQAPGPQNRARNPMTGFPPPERGTDGVR